ncbi:DUF4058 family protein [Chloroflexi bacterium TSY]|nr:DUF4058 family protein [Chloroflexi bacterium TSY]
MPTPFPGMDPYLERPSIWKQVHTNLIVDIQRYLAPILRPKYRVAIEQRTYVSVVGGIELIGEPDVSVVLPPGRPPSGTFEASQATAVAGSYTDDIPMPGDVVERYLEVRDVVTGVAVTVIEILSPSNKLSDRNEYERKRLKILASGISLVEIDLLRSGKPMPMEGDDIPTTHYRILISRCLERPKGQALLFNVRDRIPDVLIPLGRNEEEPLVPLNQMIHDLYDQAGYDLSIDYEEPPKPALKGTDANWAKQQIMQASLRLNGNAAP